MAAARAAAAGHHQQGQGVGRGPARAAGAATLFRPRQTLAQRRRVEHGGFAGARHRPGDGVDRDHRRGAVAARRPGGRVAFISRRRAAVRLSAGVRAVLHRARGARHRLGLRRHGRGARSQLRRPRRGGDHHGAADALRANRQRVARHDARAVGGRGRGAARRRDCSACCWRKIAACRSTTRTRISNSR